MLGDRNIDADNYLLIALTFETRLASHCEKLREG